MILNRVKQFVSQCDVRRRVFTCPSCSQKLRVPFKLGKLLRVNCNACSAVFDVSFKLPFLDLLSWNKELSFLQNVLLMKSRIMNANPDLKRSFFITLLCVLFFMYLLFSLIF